MLFWRLLMILEPLIVFRVVEDISTSYFSLVNVIYNRYVLIFLLTIFDQFQFSNLARRRRHPR